jgi:hypothetical protein
MNRTIDSAHAFEPERAPQDCWDWITPEEVTRMALVAFDAVKRRCRPPVGERFVVYGVAWATRDQFAAELSEYIEHLVKGRAYALGIGGEEYEHNAVMVAKWIGDPPAAVSRAAAAGDGA